MGLFSSTYKTYVASTLYNLAGDEDLRPKYLQSTIIGAALSDKNKSIGQTLSESLMNGPGMAMRNYFRWANSNHPDMPSAIVDGSISADITIVNAGLRAVLGLASNEHLRITQAFIDDADVSHWAGDYMRQNYPDVPDEDWTADSDATNITIEITGYPNVTFPKPADMIWGENRGADGTVARKILFVAYSVLSEDRPITVGPMTMFTYRMGTGNVTFDQLVSSTATMSEFYPALPLRLDGVSVTDPSLSGTYDDAAKAYKRFTGRSIDDLIASIEDNQNIDDIDFAFLVQGVPLNTKETEGKRYVYEFFKKLDALAVNTEQDFTDWATANNAAWESMISWDRWSKANYEVYTYYPKADEPAPASPYLGIMNPPMNELRVSSDSLPEFDLRVRWATIKETLHVGNAARFDGDQTRPKIEVGDYFFTSLPDSQGVTVQTVNDRYGNNGRQYETELGRTEFFPRVYLFHQYAKRRYSRLDIVGLEHRNYVYGGNSVTISGKDALNEVDEESGFLVPLHYPTLKDMGLLGSTQLATVSNYLVLNSYQIVKQSWYEKGIFRVILIVGGLALAVFSGGLSLGVGILGTNITVGLAVGATAAAAAVVGAVVNGLAAVILSVVISKASIAIFGEKLGAIIGTLVSFFALQVGAQFAQTGTFTVDWSKLMQAQNLQGLTNSVSRAYARWLEVDTQSMLDELESVRENYEDQMEEIEKLSDEILGITNGIIDPTILTDNDLSDTGLIESRESFLTRTLLTGDDIVDISHNLVENFADISLNAEMNLP